MKKNVLNAGYVELIEWMGGDKAVIRNARRCWGSEHRSSPRADENLLKHLIKLEHKTPFEAMTFTFDIKCPIFVARQWLRHRMASPMELSLRYCVADREYYIPNELLEDIKQGQLLGLWRDSNEYSFDDYELLVERGISKEQARSILPVGTYTKFYWTVNGSSLMNFLTLRTNEGAQAEIREYANIILEIVKEVAPDTFGIFEEEVLNKKK